MIKDSGNRTEFETGAVRDIQGGKGPCYLLPLNEVAELIGCPEMALVENFRQTGDIKYLYECLKVHSTLYYSGDINGMVLEVSKHFEEGAKKYQPNNWQKGIPIKSYIDSALRHLLKYRAGITDEPHSRAFVWNILCCIWTMKNKPEMDDYTTKVQG